jgi:3-keto-disaccharide hydrolase
VLSTNEENHMRVLLTGLLVLFAIYSAGCARQRVDPPNPNVLTPEESADGWQLLFDGETNAGWNTAGTVAFHDGTMRVGGAQGGMARTKAGFGDFEAKFLYRLEGEGSAMSLVSQVIEEGHWSNVGGALKGKSDGWREVVLKVKGSTDDCEERSLNGKKVGGWSAFSAGPRSGAVHVTLTASPGTTLIIRDVKLKVLSPPPPPPGAPADGAAK